MMAAGEQAGGLNLDNEERLPWLEPAGDFADDEPVSPVRLLLLVLSGLVLIAAALGALWWWQGGRDRGEGELIAAEAGPYKTPPASDGAKQFEGEGDASFAASEGLEPAGRVDPARIPEEPAVTEVPKAAAPAPKAVVEAKPDGPAPAAKAPIVVSKAPPPKAATAVAKPDAATPAPGTAIQLGAFSNEGSANRAWSSLTKRFPYLDGLGQSVVPATVGGKTVYRLRAGAGSTAAASEICGKLRVAGESCAVVR